MNDADQSHEELSLVSFEIALSRYAFASLMFAIMDVGVGVWIMLPFDAVPPLPGTLLDALPETYWGAIIALVGFARIVGYSRERQRLRRSGDFMSLVFWAVYAANAYVVGWLGISTAMMTVLFIKNLAIYVLNSRKFRYR